MSGLSSLGVGATALQAAQRGLDLAGQNIANVNTPGYSRQRLEQVAQATTAGPSMSGNSISTGDGVLVTGTTRIQDALLEARAQAARGASGSADAIARSYAGIESAFGEPGDNGIQAGLATFWNSWAELANDPKGGSARTQVLEQGTQLAATFSDVSGRLTALWGSTREALATDVAAVNGLAANVADLNDSIRAAKVQGMSTSELEDQRDRLVAQLGTSVGAVSRPMEDGTVTLTVGGSVLVSGARASALAVTGPVVGPGHGPVQVVWADRGAPVGFSDGGSLAGTVTALEVTIPTAAMKLDAVAAALAGTVNAQQAAGYDGSGAPGGAFFTGTTAGSLRIALTSPDRVAASSAPPPAADGDNADAMAAFLEAPGGVDAQYRDLVVSTGVQAQGATRRSEVQQALLTQADSARLGVSSVSLDEEMVSLMSYQHAYEAAARYISVVDSTLEALITMTR